jgi:pimeloyl-ACP methyl ester carboxylesterase
VHDHTPTPRLASALIPGAGPTIVFLHGLGCAGSRDWPPIAGSAALVGRASLWFDLLGFGLSDRPAGFSYDLAHQADLVVEELSERPGPIALVGHSMGGTLAVLVAERLAGTGRPPVAVVLAEPNLRAQDASTSAQVAAMPLDAFVAGWSAWCAGLGSPWYRASVALADPVAYHRSAVSLVRHGHGMLGRFVALDVANKAYLLGELSDQAAQGTAALTAAAGIRVVTVAGSGHELAADAPGAFAAAVAALIV